MYYIKLKIISNTLSERSTQIFLHTSLQMFVTRYTLNRLPSSTKTLISVCSVIGATTVIVS